MFQTAGLMTVHFFRDVIRSRKTLFLGLLTLIVVGITILTHYAMANQGVPPGYGALMYAGCFSFLLPFTALFYAIAAISDEFETGTAVYLFSRPLQRHGIFIGRWLSAVLTVFVLVSVVNITAWISGGDVGFSFLLRGEAAIFLGAAAYVSLFAVISSITHRPLAVGLLVIFFWESVVAQIPFDIHVLTIKYHAVSMAGSGLPLGAETSVPLAQGMFGELFQESPHVAAVVLSGLTLIFTTVSAFRYVRTQAHRGE